jgi:hypothetical protein
MTVLRTLGILLSILPLKLKVVFLLCARFLHSPHKPLKSAHNRTESRRQPVCFCSKSELVKKKITIVKNQKTKLESSRDIYQACGFSLGKISWPLSKVRKGGSGSE